MKLCPLVRVAVYIVAMLTVRVETAAERPHSSEAEASLKAGIKEVRKGVESGDGSGAAEGLFKAAVKVAPESEEGTTARVWLARIELEKAQTNTDTNKVKASVKSILSELQQRFKPDDSTWQAKVVKLFEVSVLFLERDWDRLEQTTNAMLKDIRKYSDEANPNYHEFLAVDGERAVDMEPQLSFLLVIASSIQGDFPKALEQAKEVKARFPEWSKKNGVDGTIEILEKGESPFKL